VALSPCNATTHELDVSEWESILDEPPTSEHAPGTGAAGTPPPSRTGQDAAHDTAETARPDLGSRSEKKSGSESEKLALEVQKLTLEIRALRFKHSPFGRLFEWLQGAAPVLAIATLVWTVLVNINQQDVQRAATENALFDGIYTKLGSALPSERATAVAQASSLLHHANGTHDADLLTALSNQLALDESATVRSAILNVFRNLDHSTNRTVLDSTLRNLVDLHRAAIASSRMTPFELSSATQDDRGEYFLLDQATRTGASSEELNSTFARLGSLAVALLSVLRAGGRTRTMDHIYCPGCDFSALKIDFQNVNFDDAIIPESQWSLTNLTGASFRDAVIERANFTGAQLTNADFSNDEFNMTRLDYVQALSLRNMPSNGFPDLGFYQHQSGSPIFTCANLQNANFTQFPLVTRIDRKQDGKPIQLSKQRGRQTLAAVRASDQLDGWPTIYEGANIAGANMENVREIILRPIDPRRPSEPYMKLHEVKVPDGNPIHFYVQDMPMSYLQYYDVGKNETQNIDHDNDLEALAASLSGVEHADTAKLPSGVLQTINALKPTMRSRFEGCQIYLREYAAYRNGLSH
jgi:uncharacterized protein YjbI with pentapeptide repeats